MSGKEQDVVIPVPHTLQLTAGLPFINPITLLFLNKKIFSFSYLPFTPKDASRGSSVAAPSNSYIHSNRLKLSLLLTALIIKPRSAVINHVVSVKISVDRGTGEYLYFYRI